MTPGSNLTLCVPRLALIALLAASPGLAGASKVDEAPVVERVLVTPARFENGGKGELAVEVRSPTRPRDFDYELEGPGGPLDPIGLASRLDELGNGRWRIRKEITISSWYPSGSYRFTRLKVVNDALLEGSTDPGALPRIEVRNTARPARPVIESAKLSASTLAEGGLIHLTLKVRSEAPVYGTKYDFSGPEGVLQSGRYRTYFSKVEPDLWSYTLTVDVSRWLPSGAYRFSGLVVKNDGLLESEPFSGERRVDVRNSLDPGTPVIRAVSLSAAEVSSDGGVVFADFEVDSLSPVTWLDYVYSGPRGVISRVSLGSQFRLMTPGRWLFRELFLIREGFPAGEYSISDVSVMNAGRVRSAKWGGDASRFSKKTGR